MENNEMFPKGWLKEAQAGPTKTDKETAKKLLNFTLLKIKLFTDDVPWNIYFKYIPPGFVQLLVSLPLKKTKKGIYAYLAFVQENDIPRGSLESKAAEEYLFNLFYIKQELEKYLADEKQSIKLNYILDSIFTAGEQQSELHSMHFMKDILSGLSKNEDDENKASTTTEYAEILTAKLKEAILGGRMNEGRRSPKKISSLRREIQEIIDDNFKENGFLLEPQSVLDVLGMRAGSGESCITHPEDFDLENEVIHWKNHNGQDRKTSFGRIRNIASEIRKKTLPEVAKFTP